MAEKSKTRRRAPIYEKSKKYREDGNKLFHEGKLKGIIRHKNFFLGFPAKLSYCNHNCWRMHFFPEISMPYLCEHKFFIFQSTALLSQNTALYKLNNSSAAAD